MSKQLLIHVSEDARNAIESLIDEVRSVPEVGGFNYSDAVNELILASKPDIPTIQGRFVDIKKALRVLVSKEELTVDAAIKALSDLRPRLPKKKLPDITPGEAK